MIRTSLSLGAALCLAPAALAQNVPDLGAAQLREVRGAQAISASAELPDGVGAPLIVRVRNGDQTALAEPVQVVEEGGQPLARVSLVTARRLLPGSYRLELAQAATSPTLASFSLQVGTAEEAEQAAARQQAWLTAAQVTVRTLTRSLETQARWTQARVQLGGAAANGAKAGFRQFLSSWNQALLTARMDLRTYQSRLLFPEPQAAVQGLTTIVAQLGPRADAWTKTVEDGAEPPPAATKVEAAVARLLPALALPAAEKQWWTASSLAKLPESPDAIAAALEASEIAEYTDQAQGFRLELPFGLTIQPQLTENPEQRLLLFDPEGNVNMAVVVEVREFPAATTAALLRENLLVANWEQLRGYKPGPVKELTDGRRGIRLGYTASVSRLDEREQRTQALQVALFDVPRRRVVTMAIFRAPRAQAGGAADPAEALAASLELVER